jgi:poly-gamma-glutamate synthesis protein (capsule biosynthesis protein)
MKKYIVIVLLGVISVCLVITGSLNQSVKVSFTGDILLDRGVGEKLKEKGLDYPYMSIKDLLKKTDILYGNLECPLLNEGTPTLKRRELIFKGDVLNVKSLKNAGYDVLNLANNHAMDYGGEGLASTIKVLKGESIKTLGAGETSSAAKAPVFINKNGIRIGFLSYSTFPPEGYVFNETKPDISRVDKGIMAEEIRRAKVDCDFLVVTFHWGKEFSYYPSEIQKEIAHMAVDNGCDAVVGHHPHVLQGVENYNGKLIFYSIGNFVFDRQVPMGTDESVILNLEINKKGIMNAEIIPVKIKECQPIPVSGKEVEYIIKRLMLYSEGMNAQIDVTDNVGIVK